MNALCGGEGCPLSSRELRAPRAGARRQRQGEGKEGEGAMSPPPPQRGPGGVANGVEGRRRGEAGVTIEGS